MKKPVAIAGAGAGVVAAIVVWSAFAGGADAAAPAPSSNAVSAASVSVVPTEAGPGWMWEPMAIAANMTTAIPVHPDHGPSQRDGSWRGGWSHDPLGALGAAATLIITVDTTEEQVQSHAIDGPYKAATAAFAQRGTSTTRSGVSPQLVGFWFNAYNDQQASIQLAYSGGPQYQLSLETVQLQWIDGDWRAQVGENRATVAHVNVEKLPTGFIPWQAPQS